MYWTFVFWANHTIIVMSNTGRAFFIALPSGSHPSPCASLAPDWLMRLRFHTHRVTAMGLHTSLSFSKGYTIIQLWCLSLSFSSLQLKMLAHICYLAVVSQGIFLQFFSFFKKVLSGRGGGGVQCSDNVQNTPSEMRSSRRTLFLMWNSCVLCWQIMEIQLVESMTPWSTA